MKKVKTKLKELIKNNKVLILGLILGIILSGTAVYGATILFASDEISYDDTKVAGTLGESDVQGALTKLNEKMEEYCVKKLQVGDYVTVVPDKSTYSIATSVTGYDSAQTITPNELTLWRIIKINNNGTVEAVSEYVSSTAVYFKGTTGYANLIGGLQMLASQYAKSGITAGTRMIGYDGQTLTISDTSAFNGSTTTAPLTTSTPTPTNETYQEYLGGVGGDTLYRKDANLVRQVYLQDNNETNYCSLGLCAYSVGTITKTNYWMTSRYYIYSDSTNFRFTGLYTGSASNLYYSNLRYVNNGSWSDATYGYALRPIITLKSGVEISGGFGIKKSPYTLS